MAFINATWMQADQHLRINVGHITAVIDNPQHTIIQTATPVNSGSMQYWVKESYGEIVSRIDDAERAVNR